MPDWCSQFSNLMFRILSHPLYLSYFIFFAPYFIPLFSFLSPLFITTSILSLSSFNFNFSHLRTKYNSKLGFWKNIDHDDFHSFDDLGIYDLLFGSSLTTETLIGFTGMKQLVDDDFAAELNLTDKFQNSCSEEKTMTSNFSKILDEFERQNSSSEDKRMASNSSKILDELERRNSCSEDERMTSNFSKILDEFERQNSSSEDKRMASNSSKILDGFEQRNSCSEDERMTSNFSKILDEFERMADDKEKVGAKIEKVVENQKAVSTAVLLINGSDATTNNKILLDGEKIETAKSHSHNDGGGDERERKSSLKSERSLGSMRREKEWNRTLACKLFEERHNVDGGEGMDSLWETYEVDSTKKSEKKSKRREKQEEEEEEEEVAGQLCCLQALKMSTGKMNLGVGMPNLVKISKAIKGMGWLHKHKHSKKVHHSNSRYYN